MPTFIGLDLAWTTKNESGICWLEGDSKDNLRCTRLETAACETGSLADELTAAKPAVVTIDAPLVYTPERDVEREIARRFSRYKAGPHQAHYAVRSGYTAGIDLGKALAPAGFALDPSPLLDGAQTGCYVVEVFPHTIHVRLFGLAERLKYKPKYRGQEMPQYQEHLLALIERELPRVLESSEVRLALNPDTAHIAQTKGGATLKRLDDTLDGLTCALAAWLIWDQPEHWEMIGDENGYIVAPRESGSLFSSSGC